MLRFAPSILLASSLCCSAIARAQDELTPPPGDRKYIAVVVGISSYKNLPKSVDLKHARDNASAIKQTLINDANFDTVFMLGDGQATRAGLRTLLENEVSELVDKQDVFLLYFEGHGLGSDLDIPTLLAYDSTLENGQEDGFELAAFAKDLQTWASSGTVMIVTDVVHEHELDGISFFGPAAPHWPRMPSGTMVLSSTQPEQAAEEGRFGKLFAEAMGGAADLNYDHYLTQSELYSWLVTKMAPTGQIPVASGAFEGNSIIAQDLKTAPPVVEAPTTIDGSPVIDVTAGADGQPVVVHTLPPEPLKPVYPDVEISAAKFVFHEGAAQSVQCTQSNVKACDPSCYVRYFRAGECTINAVVDGTNMQGQVIVLSKGKYDCKRKGAKLVCDGPYL